MVICQTDNCSPNWICIIYCVSTKKTTYLMQKNIFVYVYQTIPTRIWPHVDEGIAVLYCRQKIAGTSAEKNNNKKIRQ